MKNMIFGALKMHLFYHAKMSRRICWRLVCVLVSKKYNAGLGDSTLYTLSRHVAQKGVSMGDASTQNSDYTIYLFGYYSQSGLYIMREAEHSA